MIGSKFEAFLAGIKPNINPISVEHANAANTDV